MLIHLRFINISHWGVTETILQSVTLAFVIAFPLNHNAKLQKKIDICKFLTNFFVSNLYTIKKRILRLSNGL